jgi:hypothetical protein
VVGDTRCSGGAIHATATVHVEVVAEAAGGFTAKADVDTKAKLDPAAETSKEVKAKRSINWYVWVGILIAGMVIIFGAWSVIGTLVR